MALQQQQQQHPLSFLNSSSSSSSSNSCNLYCQEEEEEERYPYWGDKDKEEDVVLVDDEELLCLFSKEQQQQQQQHIRMDEDDGIDEGVEWMVKAAISHCGFSILTAVLAINYMRRFLSTFPIPTDNNNKKKKKPWMIQLVAVTCLSLAAKVEEIHVPLLIDLQVGEAKYVFEGKTIERMELVVLSTLKWKMHPITPLSFLDHFLRSLPLNTQQLHYNFHFLLNTSHLLILSLLSDSRSMRFLPSVLAAATMMHLIHQLHPTNSLHCNNHLLRLLRVSKEKVDGCYQLIEEIMSTSTSNRKRKLESSPHLLSSKEKENEEEEEEDSSSSSSSSLTKRSRLFIEINNKSCGNGKFGSLNHAFAIGSDH